MVQKISECRNDMITYVHSLNKAPDDKDYPFHTHNICEIIYLKDGDISAIIGEKTYKLQKGSLVIFRANVPHRIRVDSCRPYDRHNILFDETKLANGIYYKFSKDLDLINCYENDRITDLFDKVDYYYGKFRGDNLNVLVTNIIEEILFNIYASPAEELNTDQISTNPVIASAVSYMNAHYKEPITIEDISKEVCVTKSYLHHLFMKDLGISPKKFIIMKRLSKAQKLIGMGKKPTEVFSQCGFTDYATFFRNYTNYFGYAPSQREEIFSERKIEL